MSNVSELVGRTLIAVTKVEGTENDMLLFTCADGSRWEMTHHQNCCESVSIEDIVGDLDDLIGVPIEVAEERTQEGESDPDSYGMDSSTWTFYEFRTIKGSVTIRWFGSSNGYYSESVDFYRADKDWI